MKNSYEQMGPSIQEEEGISFKDILATIKKHLIAIILFLGVSAVGGFVGAHVRDAVSPTYSANATIMVAYSNTDAINQSAYSYSNSIAETVASFIKDDLFFKLDVFDFDKSKGLLSVQVGEGQTVNIPDYIKVIQDVSNNEHFKNYHLAQSQKY